MTNRNRIQITTFRAVMHFAALLVALSVSSTAVAGLDKETASKLYVKDFPTPQQVIEGKGVPYEGAEGYVMRNAMLKGLTQLIMTSVPEENKLPLPAGVDSVRAWRTAFENYKNPGYSKQELSAAELRVVPDGETSYARVWNDEWALMVYFPELYNERESREKMQLASSLGLGIGLIVGSLVVALIVVRIGRTMGIFESPWFLPVALGIPAAYVAYLFMGPTLSAGAAVVTSIALGFYLHVRGRDRLARAEHLRIKKEEEAWWSSLGETPEERARSINKMFDESRGVISFEGRVDWKENEEKDDMGHRSTEILMLEHSIGHNWLQFKLHSNIATMNEEWREWLRALELLRNWDLLGELDYPALKVNFLSEEFDKEAERRYEVDYSKQYSKNANGILHSGNNEPHALFQAFWDVRCKSKGIQMNREALLNHLDRCLAEPDPNPLIRSIRGRLSSGGGWLSSHEIADSVFSIKSDYPLHIGYLDDTDELLTFSGEGAMLTVAPPGSGKTQCNVFPNLLTWKGPAVVLDVKGEIYEGTSKWRSENVGPVFKFSPLDPDNSHCFNPLTYIRREPDWIWEDSRFMADMMIVPSGSGGDPFWENKAKELLTAAVAAVCFYNDENNRPMSKVMELINGMHWDDFIRALTSAKNVNAMVMAGSSLKEMQQKTRDSMMQVAQSSMSAWAGSRIERATSRSDWSPLDLRGGQNPTIYICLKPNEVEAYISLLRVFIAQHIRMLTSELPPREAAPVLLMLDELPRLKFMPPVEEAIEIGRQYGLRLWMFVQSLGQLESSYPNAQGMISSCAVRIFMNPSTADGSADKIADELGHLGATVSDRELAGTDLAGPRFRDYQIVIAGSNKPAKVRKAFTYMDDELSSRMGSL